MLRIRTFGGCRLERDGTPLDELSGQRKSLAALALLAGASPRGLTRESLTALLWPDSDEERARTSLKQLVHSLRRQLGVVDLFLPTGDLRLNPELVTSDLGEFRDAASRGEHQAAVLLYAGPFLEGFYVRGADGFERWASEQRAALARDFARALEALAEAASRGGDTQGAVDAWRRLAIAESLNARAAKGLMRALDAVCKFYERTEPGNPAPLLIRRAQRLMHKSFVEIMQDLAPESLGTIRNIAGLKDE